MMAHIRRATAIRPQPERKGENRGEKSFQLARLAPALCVKNVHSMHTSINIASITSERKKRRRKAIRSSSSSVLSSTLVCVEPDLFCDVVLTPCGQV